MAWSLLQPRLFDIVNVERDHWKMITCTEFSKSVWPEAFFHTDTSSSGPKKPTKAKEFLLWTWRRSKTQTARLCSQRLFFKSGEKRHLWQKLMCGVCGCWIWFCFTDVKRLRCSEDRVMITVMMMMMISVCEWWICYIYCIMYRQRHVMLSLRLLIHNIHRFECHV